MDSRAIYMWQLYWRMLGYWLLAIGYWIWGVRHFADDVAESVGGEAVKTLAVGNNANACHLYCGGGEENAFLLWRKETHWTRFLAEEDDCVETPCGSWFNMVQRLFSIVQYCFLLGRQF